MTNVIIDAWSAGGGNNNISWGSGGGGGGSGEYRKISLNVLPNTIFPITVGVGGRGGLSESNGTPGGLTQIGTILTLQGGNGGGAGVSRGSGGISYGNGNSGGAGACYTCWNNCCGGAGGGGGSGGGANNG